MSDQSGRSATPRWRYGTPLNRLLCRLGRPRWVTAEGDRYCRACGEVIR